MKKNDHYFLLDKFNKFSIRGLLTAFEKWFPEIEYKVIKVEDLHKLKGLNAHLYLSFNSINWENYKKIYPIIKETGSNTICGGPHPTARGEEMLQFFDAVCIGEGEIAIKYIVSDCINKHRAEGIYRCNELATLDDYNAYPRKKQLFGAIEITRGCLFRCNYCQTPNLHNNSIRHRRVGSILDDVKYGMQFGKSDIRFITPDAAAYKYKGKINNDKIYQLLNGIKSIPSFSGRIYYGSFPSEINPYHVNEDFVRIVQELCSNRRVVIGLQSASKFMVKKMNRPDNIEKVEAAIELFLKYKFAVDVDFIFGLPYENEESVADTIEWIDRWYKKVRIHSHYFMPLPGSKWENENPTDIPENLVRYVRSLEGKSRVFGQWATQLEISRGLVNA